MPKGPRIYTRTGDDGTTGLASGRRVSKADLRVEAYGTVDELNAVLGVVLAEGCRPELADTLERVQSELFDLGTDLCFLESEKEGMELPQIEEGHVKGLERAIDRLSEELAPLKNFILPGGALGAARLHFARTVCRRAERLAVALGASEPVGEWVVKYLNRLSDYLFVAARFENLRQGIDDVPWRTESP